MIKKLTSLIIFLISLIYSSCKVGETKEYQNKSGLEIEADSIFDEWNNNATPGLAAAVLKNGEVIFSKGYGLSNLEYGVPIEPNTVFHAASLSKQFTAYSILMLEKEGKLALEDDVRKYIPEVPDFGRAITLKHLASHTSGLRDQWGLLALAGWRFDDVITTGHILNLVSKQKSLNFNPGDEFMYCNTGYTLLAEIVSRVSGMTFPKFTQQYIFEPLNMNNTLFFDDHEKIVRNRAYSYYKANGIYKKSRLNFATVGATSLFTTVEDMMKWASYLNEPSEEYNGLVEKLNTRPTLNNGYLSEAALGQFRGEYFGMELIDHSGADAGYRAYFGRFPENNSAVILLVNSPVNAPNLALQLATVYLREKYVQEEKPEAGNKVLSSKNAQTTAMPVENLSAYEATYWNPEEGRKIEIVVRRNKLQLVQHGVDSIPLVIKSKHALVPSDAQNNMRLEYNEQINTASKVVFVQNGLEKTFLKFGKADLSEYKGEYKSEELDSNYKIRVEDNKVFAVHNRLGEVRLIPVQRNYMTSDNPYFRTVEFLRNETGKVYGFRISNGGVRNLLFVKI